MNSASSVQTGPSIGRLNEGALHAALKRWCAQPGDRLEAQVDGYVVDVVQGDLLIEVQTGSFPSIRDKLCDLVTDHSVRLVYPIIKEKVIVKLDPHDQAVISRRRSPKKGQWFDLFDELVYLPTLLNHPHFELLAVQVAIDELRCDDGQGSWRNKGVRILKRELREVLTARLFTCSQDLAQLLPQELEQPFTHRQLAREMGVRLATAQRASYCLRKLGVLRVAGRKGRAMLLEGGDASADRSVSATAESEAKPG